MRIIKTTMRGPIGDFLIFFKFLDSISDIENGLWINLTYMRKN